MINKEIKVYHATGYESYSSWIPNVVIVDTIEECDVIVFEGGEDINPALYGDKIGKYTSFYDKRDNLEIAAYKKGLELSKAMWGTCRGLQLLTAMAGGRLVQDMDHSWGHSLTMYDGSEFHTNTLHHQMAYPYELKQGEDYYLLAAAYGISGNFLDGSNKQMKMPVINGKTEEPEFLFYPKINALGIQGHPEMMPESSEMVAICRLFLELQLDGVLQDVLDLNIPVAELFERTAEVSFEFREDELELLKQTTEKATTYEHTVETA